MNRMTTRVVVALGLVAIGLFAMRSDLSGPPEWTPDGLFYQARALELDGVDETTALERTFGGPMGARLRAIDPQRSGDLKWAAYFERFYERRISVPLAASVLEPAAGERALLDISIAGYIAAVLAIFGLLLLRFRIWVAGAVALLTAFLPALTSHAGFPQTDSWGLALESAALAFGILAVQREARWVVAWALAILVLSFTRDSTWVPLIAAAYLAFRLRSRTSWTLVGSGLAAALPVLLLFSVPTRELLASMLNDTLPNPDGSWGFVLSRYPGAVLEMLQADGGFVRDGAWYSALYLLGGLGLLFLLGRGDEAGPTTMFLKAAALAGGAFVLVVPVFSAFRIELTLVPMAAFGIALLTERVAERAALRMSIFGRLAVTDRSHP